VGLATPSPLLDVKKRAVTLPIVGGPCLANTVKDPILIRLAGLTASLLIRLVHFTCRKRLFGDEHVRKLFADKQNFILASFHNRVFFGMFAYTDFRTRGRKMVALASASKDGGIIAWALHGFGYLCERGSSSKGGVGALKKMIRHARQGKDLSWTPDGPRGPKYHVHNGIILAASMSGVPILPATYQAQRRRELRSWDALILPRFFSRINVVYAEPIRIPPKCSKEQVEAYAQQLRESLLQIGEKAEEF